MAGWLAVGRVLALGVCEGEQMKKTDGLERYCADVLRLILLCGVLALSACADTRYYLQSVSGHLAVMQAARPVTAWLDDGQTPPQLRARLLLAQRIRQFAVSDLALPDNVSYHRYADLQRRAVVWNVVAAPALSLTLKQWCYPVAGCVDYRGYFDEADAWATAAELRTQGLEVGVYGVPAYSTLGWLNWAGGDPLLNTFIQYPEGELAGLIFHELAHQLLYVKDDTAFNESFATVVGRQGAERWLLAQGSPQARQAYAVHVGRRIQFRTLITHTRGELARIYQENGTLAHDESTQLAMKNIAMKDFRLAYAQLISGWGQVPNKEWSEWVLQANNATFGSLQLYDELVPQFEALLAHEGGDWPCFYAAVKSLTRLPKEERHHALHAIGRKALSE